MESKVFYIKVGENHIQTKYCNCNTFQVVSDLAHDFMNFSALKLIPKIHKKTRLRTHLWPDAGCIHRQRPTNIV